MPKRKNRKNRSLGFDRLRIEDESIKSDDQLRPSGVERALLVAVRWRGLDEDRIEEYLSELELLARTAGAEIADSEIVKRPHPDPALLIGKGKAAELAEIIKQDKVDLVIMDEDLAPAQTRNLERVLECRVIDRSALILDIFARRARSREAKTQVELAQLRYMLPRLSGAWTHLERQRGGIGLRGPGETQIETDRRIIRERIRHLKEELEHIEKVRSTQQANRGKFFRFALAGYTNVGKSTLMNALTEAGVYEENLLFATLDSTTRLLRFEGGMDALLTDTVGFIRKLPPGLVASFRSTLAEIREADCIIHVVDLATVHWLDQMAEVKNILEDMQLGACPTLLVFNKVDAVVEDRILRQAQADFPDAVFISARRQIGLDQLRACLFRLLTDAMVDLSLRLPAGDGRRRSELYRTGHVYHESTEDNQVLLKVRMTIMDARRLGLMDETHEKQ